MIRPTTDLEALKAINIQIGRGVKIHRPSIIPAGRDATGATLYRINGASCASDFAGRRPVFTGTREPITCSQAACQG